MNRDYAKRKLPHKKSRKNYFYLWLTMLLLFAALIISLLGLAKYKNYPPPKLIPINAMQKKQKMQQSAPEEIVSKTVTTPKFDFYNISPQKKNRESKIAYELEIATVDGFVTADHLKAELALLGFAASITPIYQNSKQKHYISVGPYDNKDGAIADQQKLKLNKIKSTLKKVR